MPIDQYEWKTIARNKQIQRPSNEIKASLDEAKYSHIQREIIGHYNENQSTISFQVTSNNCKNILKNMSVNSIFQVAYSLQQPIIQNKKIAE
tara:strand:+ start:86407 stop:86682 length:276 start_codon:yes stop_codon:yes gene_type:complete